MKWRWNTGDWKKYCYEYAEGTNYSNGRKCSLKLSTNNTLQTL